MRTQRSRPGGRRSRVVAVLTLVLVVGGWWVFLRPAALGGPLTLVTVTGSSMEPGMRTGDLAVVRSADGYAAGDVLAYRPRRDGGEPGGVVIHRIVDGDPVAGFRMRGDNNDFDDPWRPTAADAVGELVLHVPGAGRVVMAMADPLLAAAACASLTAFLVIAGGRREDEVPTTDADAGERV